MFKIYIDCINYIGTGSLKINIWNIFEYELLLLMVKLTLSDPSYAAGTQKIWSCFISASNDNQLKNEFSKKFIIEVFQ